MRFLLDYDEERHSEGMPGPLNGPSMALGTLEDLRPYLNRIPTLMADSIELERDASQKTIGRLLGVSQSNIAASKKAGIERIKWLMCEPEWSRRDALREILSLVLPSQAWAARVVVYWLGSVYSFTHGLMMTRGRAEFPTDPGRGQMYQGQSNYLLRTAIIPGASPSLRAVLDWRARAGYCVASSPSGIPELQERPLRWLPILPEEHPFLVSMHERGIGYLRASRLYGCSDSSVALALRDAGVRPRPGTCPGSSERKDEARKYRDEGLSWRAIGRKMGVTHTTARSYLRDRPSSKNT